MERAGELFFKKVPLNPSKNFNDGRVIISILGHG
jgi:hypothetical protein